MNTNDRDPYGINYFRDRVRGAWWDGFYYGSLFGMIVAAVVLLFTKRL